MASARAPVPASRQADSRRGEFAPDAAAARIAALEAENQALRDRLDFYELTVFGDILQFPATWNLTRAENRIMGVLLSLNIAHRDAIMTAVYGDSPDLEPDAKIVDVMVCKLRAKVRRHGVEIRTVRGLGFAIEQPRRSEIRRALRMISPPFPWETAHG